MALDKAFFDGWTPRALALLRIVAAFLFIQHGAAKLLHVPHVAMFDQLPLVSLAAIGVSVSEPAIPSPTVVQSLASEQETAESWANAGPPFWLSVAL